MKKFLLLLLTLSMLCFAGCQEADNTESMLNSDATNTGGMTGEVHEYNSNGQIIKTTVYDDDGSIQYVETTDYLENGTCRTVFDADGVEILRDENYGEAYTGGVQHTHQITENGVITLLSITDTSDSGATVMISEGVQGTAKSRAVTALDVDGSEYYMLYEVIDGGVLTEYFCWRDCQDAEVFTRQITYVQDTDMYELVEKIFDPSIGDYTSTTTMIPSEEYVRADWEILK